MNTHKRKNNKCKLCKKLIDDRAKYCQRCAGIVYSKIRIKTRRSYKGINNPAYINGKSLKKYYCSICGKQLGISAYRGSKYCKKHWRSGLSKHHQDLNSSNNNEINLWFLPDNFHQLFHRLAYHYLLEKFGIKEICRYKKWFIKKYMIK